MIILFLPGKDPKFTGKRNSRQGNPAKLFLVLRLRRDSILNFCHAKFLEIYSTFTEI